MTEPAKLVILGAGGLGREVLATVRACNEAGRQWDVLGFLDADEKLAGKKVGGVPVLGGDDWYRNNQYESLRFVCAIGKPEVRSRVVETMSAVKSKFVSVVHPAVQVAESVAIGAGTVIMAGTQFTADIRIGSHVVIYLNCSITHDVCVGDFCVIPSGCNLSGGAILETGVLLGSGVSVLPRRRIGAWATIGAGSVVVKDIPPKSTAMGAPCRVIEQRPGS
ncbi:MAG TPA: acetyltransferase [Candidatus Sulfotelmatobacter sp.]